MLASALYLAAKASSCGLLALQGPHQCALNVTTTFGLLRINVAKASGESNSCNIVLMDRLVCC
eukprot:scaffold42656_cov160-Amphora_coffeaeformis.AAC.1